MKRSHKSLKGAGFAMAASLLGLAMPTVAGASSFALTAADATTTASFSGLVTSVVNVVLYVAGAAAVLYMVYSGFQYVTAGGDDDKAATARKGLINAIIGIVIVMAVYFIFQATKGVGSKVGSAGGVASGTEL